MVRALEKGLTPSLTCNSKVNSKISYHSLLSSERVSYYSSKPRTRTRQLRTSGLKGLRGPCCPIPCV